MCLAALVDEILAMIEAELTRASLDGLGGVSASAVVCG